MRRGPTPSSAPWLYCERHKPEGAEPLPADLPYSVTRLSVEIIVSRADVHPATAADMAVRHVVHALEGMGAIVQAVQVQGGRARIADPAAAGLRLTLGGPALPLPESGSMPGGPPAAAAGFSHGRRR